MTQRQCRGAEAARQDSGARVQQPAPRAVRGGAPAVLNPLLALVEAIEAATAWHRAQTTAAPWAAVLLGEAADLTTTGTPAHTTASRTTSRTVRRRRARRRRGPPRAPYG
ncbi:hypothetical protein ACWLMY_37705 [Streptomyces anulatus]